MPRKRKPVKRRAKPTRRRPSRNVSLIPWLWVILVANLGAGIAFSPVTAVRVIRVDGAPAYDHDRITALLQEMSKIPCARVSGAMIETLIQGEGDVAGANLRRNPFGRATLAVSYRRPVAVLEGKPGVVLSDTGVLYAARNITTPLPKLRLRDETSGLIGVMAGVWPAQAVAKVCKRAFEFGPPEKAVLDVDSSGRLCLNMGTGAQIDLGSSDELDRKFSEVHRVIQGHPSLIEEGFGINVTEPDKPVIVPPTLRNKL